MMAIKTDEPQKGRQPSNSFSRPMGSGPRSAIPIFYALAVLQTASPTTRTTMTTTIRARHARAPTQLGFLIDELRSAGVTTYADLAATLNSQGIRPVRER